LSHAPADASGQVVARLELEVRSPEGFGFVSTVRPMPDGRVLVADPLGQALVVVSLDAHAVDTVGSVGSGPGEYRIPDAVFALPGDSTLLVDLGNGRLTVIAGEGRFARYLPIMQQAAGAAFPAILPRSTDGRGRIYYQTERLGGGAANDSAEIVRLDMQAGRTDTLARVGLAGPARTRGRAAVLLGRAPLGPKDDWAVAADGRVAVIRAADYSVHWIRPGQPSIDGPPSSFRPVPVGRAEKEAWADEFFGASISMSIRRSSDGEREVRFSRGSRGREDLDIDQIVWPSHLPPFRPGRSTVAPYGDLWVERYGREGQAVTVDVFDGLGRKRGEVRLPAGRRVGGFGAGVVYLLYTDELGLQWLERYRIRPTEAR